MRTTIAATTAAVILLSSTQLPAQAATPEAPTDVQLSWADSGKRAIRVTWKDTGEANYVHAEVDGLVLNPGFWLGTTDADGINEAIIENPFTGRDKMRLTVHSRVGGIDSARTPSVWFDTQRPAAARIAGATALPDQSLRLTWTQAAATPDLTPNDPLDRPATAESLVMVVTPANGGPAERFPLPLGTTTTTVPPRPRPYPVQVIAANEWGQSLPDSPITFGTMAAGLRIDPLAEFLGAARFDVVASATKGCAGCTPISAGIGQVTYLQSRIDASKPWKTIGRYTGAQGPKFSSHVTSYGGQQYRIYIPAWSDLARNRIVTPAASTSARYSATQADFIVAGFNTLNARVGQVITATVRIRPEPTLKASLQWYDGKVWHHGAYIPLTKGQGTLALKAAGRGTTRYWRVAVPKMSFNGKPIVATGSRAFKLTVS
jgi:hypothetical protein